MKLKTALSALLISVSTLTFSEKISEIQGKSMYSNFENKEVNNVEGVITAIRNTKYNKGFFMQSKKADSDLNTSEGIYVENKSGEEIKIGDLVTVKGTVKEIYFGAPNKTQPPITSIQASELKVISSNNKVNPVIISGKYIPKQVKKTQKFDRKQNALDYYESLEGMLVKIVNPTITGFKEKYGDITVVPSYGKYSTPRSKNKGVLYSNYKYEQTQRITISGTPWNLVEKGEFKNDLSPNPGDRLKGSVEGIVMYEHGEYRLYPTSAFPGIKDSKTAPETNKYTYNKNLINVISYNIENFTIADGGEVRVKQLAKQVKTILQTPDILGLIEVGDDDGGNVKTETTVAKKTIESLVEAIKQETGIDYGYMNIDPIHGKDGGWPEMHIRNVILYRKDRIKVVGFNQGDATKDTEVVKVDGKVRLTYNPGKIGTQDPIWDEVRKPLIGHFEFKGKNLFVLANHLKSKRADNKVYSVEHPVSRKSELVRNPEGTYINNFVKEILKADPKAEIIVLGDMNDFNFSKTIKNINGNELVDVITQLPTRERSTYVYQGASQTLDNIMINKKHSGKINIDVLRVNSEFTVKQGSFSDHDPVFIQYKIKK